MDDQGIPKLSGFLICIEKGSLSDGSLRGNTRWLAYELLFDLDPAEGDEIGNEMRQSTASDIWAFGMVIYVKIDNTQSYDVVLMISTGNNIWGDTL